MNPLLTQGAGAPRAWTDDSHAEWDREVRSYGPDEDDDGDGDGDDDPDAERSGLWFRDDPDDESTQEVVIEPVPGPMPAGADEYDDDRR